MYCSIVGIARKLKLLTAISVLSIVISACGGSGATESSNVDNSTTPEHELALAPEESLTPELGAAIESGDTVDKPGAVTQDRSPEIVSISLGCDLVLDTISLKLGETSTFSIAVDDEVPSTLQYQIASDDPLLVDATFENGIVNLNPLSAGSTTLPIRVIDENGNQDEVLLSILVKN